MNYTIEAHKEVISTLMDVIDDHKVSKNEIHAYSFMVQISLDSGEELFCTINDFKEEDFNERMKQALKNELYPFSIFHKRKHLQPLDHVAFLNSFTARMSRRGRLPSLKMNYRDSRRPITQRQARPGG